ncbi:unnamed protein product [Symbiodinium sp. KB8]|nr:unnamed protein product [Symbiodinium sp. KB8]
MHYNGLTDNETQYTQWYQTDECRWEERQRSVAAADAMLLYDEFMSLSNAAAGSQLIREAAQACEAVLKVALDSNVLFLLDGSGLSHKPGQSGGASMPVTLKAKPAACNHWPAPELPVVERTPGHLWHVRGAVFFCASVGVDVCARPISARQAVFEFSWTFTVDRAELDKSTFDFGFAVHRSVVSNAADVVESCQTSESKLRQLHFMIVDGDLVMPGLRFPCGSLHRSGEAFIHQQTEKAASRSRFAVDANLCRRKRSRSPRRVEMGGAGQGSQAGEAEASDTLRDSQLDGELLEEPLGALGDTQIDGFQDLEDARPSAFPIGGMVPKLTMPLDMAVCYADTQVVEDLPQEFVEQSKAASADRASPHSPVAASVPEPVQASSQNGSCVSCSCAENTARSQQDSQASRVSWGGGSDAEELALVRCRGRCTEALSNPQAK